MSFNIKWFSFGVYPTNFTYHSFIHVVENEAVLNAVLEIVDFHFLDTHNFCISICMNVILMEGLELSCLCTLPSFTFYQFLICPFSHSLYCYFGPSPWPIYDSFHEFVGDVGFWCLFCIVLYSWYHENRFIHYCESSSEFTWFRRCKVSPFFPPSTRACVACIYIYMV